MPGIDYRKLPYDPKSGKRTLVVCAITVITGFAALVSPLSNPLERGIALFGHRVSLGFMPILLIALGVFNVIPAVIRLTPPSKR